MTFIVIAMLTLIILSIILELILPTGLKRVLGTGICWGMMAITMTFLGLSTLALIYVAWTNILAPLLA
jgi:hypothetical protein